MKLTDEQLNAIIDKADADLDKLKDRCHDLYEENERIEKEYKSKVDEIGKLTSRIYKAIEYIKSGKTFDDEDTRKVVDKIQNDLLNILQNGSDEE